MRVPRSAERPHSAEYFGEERDHWWNADFLDLMACRLRLTEITSIVDVGCGIGHWSALIHPRLAPGAGLIGIDLDPANVAGALERTARLARDSTMNFVQGDALALPLPDACVDAATCQTLLIHLADPQAALDEMIRVTRPGGLILAIEPNNMSNSVGASSLTAQQSVQDIVLRAEIAWRSAIGRTKRGLGCEFIGDLLPGMFAASGLEQVNVWLSDKVVPLFPPYDGPGQPAILATSERWAREGIGPFDRDLLRDNVLAGGGTEALVEAAERNSMTGFTARLQGIRDGSYHAAQGGLFYLVAGRVPAPR
jgi:2-polyprenyl-3-methyl-5-hydroxy-6-metoxy-1,4-benzoquinol methylase